MLATDEWPAPTMDMPVPEEDEDAFARDSAYESVEQALSSGYLEQNIFPDPDPFGMHTLASTLPGNLFLSVSDTRVYTSLWQQATGGLTMLGPTEAVQFFSLSRLSNLVLGGIWQLADQERRGTLSKEEFFLAAKLVALAQQGVQPLLENVNVPAPPPALGAFTERALQDAAVRRIYFLFSFLTDFFVSGRDILNACLVCWLVLKSKLKEEKPPHFTENTAALGKWYQWPGH
jgi:hypothetical protein